MTGCCCCPIRLDPRWHRVDSEEDLYRLWVEGYQGNATDSLGSHNGYAFSTFDRDNDEAPVRARKRLGFLFSLSLDLDAQYDINQDF